MKGAVVIVVLTLLAALTTPHPYYQSYNPRNGNSVNMQSGKDLTRRPQASWQEYAAGLMQGKKPTEVSPTVSPSKFIDI